MRRIIVFLLVTVVLAVIGLAAGTAAAFALPSYILSQWEAWGTPPENAVELVRPHQYAVRNVGMNVLTGSGEVYRCCDGGKRVWEPVTEVLQADTADCARYAHDPATHPAFRNLRGTIVDCAILLRGSQFEVDNDIYAVLSDGSVWHLTDRGTIGESLFVIVGLTFLLVLVGWVAMALFFRRREARAFRLPKF